MSTEPSRHPSPTGSPITEFQTPAQDVAELTPLPPPAPANSPRETMPSSSTVTGPPDTNPMTAYSDPKHLPPLQDLGFPAIITTPFEEKYRAKDRPRIYSALTLRTVQGLGLLTRRHEAASIVRGSLPEDFRFNPVHTFHLACSIYYREVLQFLDQVCQGEAFNIDGSLLLRVDPHLYQELNYRLSGLLLANEHINAYALEAAGVRLPVWAQTVTRDKGTVDYKARSEEYWTIADFELLACYFREEVENFLGSIYFLQQQSEGPRRTSNITDRSSRRTAQSIARGEQRLKENQARIENSMREFSERSSRANSQAPPTDDYQRSERPPVANQPLDSRYQQGEDLLVNPEFSNRDNALNIDTTLANRDTRESPHVAFQEERSNINETRNFVQNILEAQPSTTEVSRRTFETSRFTDVNPIETTRFTEANPIETSRFTEVHPTETITSQPPYQRGESGFSDIRRRQSLSQNPDTMRRLVAPPSRGRRLTEVYEEFPPPVDHSTPRAEETRTRNDNTHTAQTGPGLGLAGGFRSYFNRGRGSGDPDDSGDDDPRRGTGGNWPERRNPSGFGGSGNNGRGGGRNGPPQGPDGPPPSPGHSSARGNGSTNRPSEFYFDFRLKPDAIPEWDGNSDALSSWLLRLNSFARHSSTIRLQLGKIVPLRLKGLAARWYYSLSTNERADAERSWETIREKIGSYFMTRSWFEKQRSRALRLEFREDRHRFETPSDYVIRKYELLSLCFNMDDAELILEVMSSAPPMWSSIIHTQYYQTFSEFQTAVKYHEDTLIELYRTGGSVWRSNKFDSRPERSTFTQFRRNPDQHPRREGGRFGDNQARVNLVGQSPTLPKPQFPKDDSNVSKGKTPESVGVRPCRYCGSGRHWDKECKFARKAGRMARTNLAIVEDDDEAQQAYDDAYYGQSDSEFDDNNEPQDEEDCEQDF